MTEALSGKQFVLRRGDAEATIVEVGGGVRTYAVAGRDILAGYGTDVVCPRAAGAVLVPWPNRLAGGTYTFDGVTHQAAISEPALGNANHGLGRWTRWNVVTQSQNSVTLGWAVPPQSGYPFQLDVRTTWTLDDDGLQATHEAVNVGDTAAPFGIGIHPYLAINGADRAEVTVRVPATLRVLVDDNKIPTGTKPVDGTADDLRAGRPLTEVGLDLSYAAPERGADGRAVASVEYPGGGGTIWMDEAFDWIQVFTPDALPDHPAAVAIEPMSCAANAFNSGDGLVVLAPGDRWTGSWGVSGG
ncbi:aldose 1-epimerase family protein [Fodinicola acaciae]|uniref:aldose 1-epimerase family protein n=1 Tax=Fodinicola acaciae TaxID=2681555 RepID=UPI0013D3BB63|nr:aldose 1-epimerase family protein [Fodinicola acaciae]